MPAVLHTGSPFATLLNCTPEVLLVVVNKHSARVSAHQIRDNCFPRVGNGVNPQLILHSAGGSPEQETLHTWEQNIL